MTTEEQSAAGTVYDTVRDDDGNIVSSTATTRDAAGNVVSVVERTFDADGNVASATYTDHSVDHDTGETSTEVTVYEGGTMVQETSTTTTSSGVVIERSITTYDDEGDRDTTEVRTFDPGGAPLTSSTTYYDDDGQPMMTAIQAETGQSAVSYAPGEHTRTTRNDDGSVTRETVRVGEDGTIDSRTTELSDADGEIQSSSETYYDDDGEPELSNEVVYADGQATKQTTTTTTDEGTFVSEQHLDENAQPTGEVRTSYDGEGNVTSTTYREYGDDGAVTDEGDEPPRSEIFEQVAEMTDMPDLDLPPSTLDASAVLTPAGAETPAVVVEDLDLSVDASTDDDAGDALSSEFIKLADLDLGSDDFHKVEVVEPPRGEVGEAEDAVAKDDDFIKWSSAGTSGDDFLKMQDVLAGGDDFLKMEDVLAGGDDFLKMQDVLAGGDDFLKMQDVRGVGDDFLKMQDVRVDPVPAPESLPGDQFSVETESLPGDQFSVETESLPDPFAGVADDVATADIGAADAATAPSPEPHDGLLSDPIAPAPAVPQAPPSPGVELPSIQQEPLREVASEIEAPAVHGEPTREPEVELSAVQKEPEPAPAVEPAPAPEIADLSDVAGAPTFQEPIDHSVVREGLDVDTSTIDTDALRNPDDFDDGFAG